MLQDITETKIKKKKKKSQNKYTVFMKTELK